MLELLFPQGSEHALATDMTPEFVEVGIDWIALSFVQQPADIVELRERVETKPRLRGVNGAV